MAQTSRQKYVLIEKAKGGRFRAWFTTRDGRRIGIMSDGRTPAEALGSLVIVTPEVIGLEITRPLTACAECQDEFLPEHLDEGGYCGACGQSRYL